MDLSGKSFVSESTSDTKLHRIISVSKETQATTNDAVQVPPLLQDLFGIDYLPRAQPNRDLPQVDDDDVRSIRSELSSTEGEQRLSSEVNGDDSLERKNRRMSIVRLASRVGQARERRKTRRHKNTAESTADGLPKRPTSQINATRIEKQLAKLEEHKAGLRSLQEETHKVESRAKCLANSLSEIQQQVLELEEKLAQSMVHLQRDSLELQQTKKDLKSLETRRNKAARAVQETVSSIRRGAAPQGIPPLPSPARRKSLDDDPVLNPLMATPKVNNLVEERSVSSAAIHRRADSAPIPGLRRTESYSFIRVHDLDLSGGESSSLSEGSLPFGSSLSDPLPAVAKEMAFLDDDVATVVTALARSGYDLVTDETDRFSPVLNTERLLAQAKPVATDPSWPVQPWHAPSGKDILVWIGCVDHDGHGCNIPMVKARGIIPTAPRNVVDLMLDSSRVGEYNNMSQGRHDVHVLQKGIDTTAEESELGIPGEAKIVKSLNKPPLIRTSIEMLSLIYAHHLEHSDGYLCVSRSVWEDSSASVKSAPSKDTVRSEIFLGVNLFRPIPHENGQYCEMTTITHAHASGIVPGGLARKMGPSQAANFVRDIQGIFTKE